MDASREPDQTGWMDWVVARSSRLEARVKARSRRLPTVAARDADAAYVNRNTVRLVGKVLGHLRRLCNTLQANCSWHLRIGTDR